MPSFSPFQYKSRNENHPAERWILNQKSAIDLRVISSWPVTLSSPLSSHEMIISQLELGLPVLSLAINQGFANKLMSITSFYPAVSAFFEAR